MKKKIFLKKLESKVFLLDGAMGTMLQTINFNGCPEELNITNPEIIKKIHKAYFNSGAELILTNTFGANKIKLAKFGLEKKVKEINKAGVKIARDSCPRSIIVGDIGPIGDYIEPLGKISFEEAYKSYKEQTRALSNADILLIETISDLRILKAALIAAREEFDGPIISSMTIQDGRTITGTDIETYVAVAERLADVIGVNCSNGPKELFKIGKIIAKLTNKPLFLKPNAGIPKIINDKTVWDYSIKEFAIYIKKYVNIGASIVGGCCGTNPDFIKESKKKIIGLKPKKRKIKSYSKLSSRTKTIKIKSTMIAGERINPTNKPGFIDELKKNKSDYIKAQSLQQVEEGAKLLNINVGILGINEKKLLPFAINIVQNIIDVPLIIDSSNPIALEKGLKNCIGKPLINSFNASKKSIEQILPLAKKYGASIVGLCLDNDGMPKTVKNKILISKKLIIAAKKYNIPNEDLFIDPLVLTLATNENNIEIIIESLEKIKKLGCNTFIGLSNISHGLPNRNIINSKFFKKVKQKKLDIALMNPLDTISLIHHNIITPQKKTKLDYDLVNEKNKIKIAIINGDFENIKKFSQEALKKSDSLSINEIIIEGINIVGKKFNDKEIFLPEVLLSAKTAKIAFNILKPLLKKEGEKSKGKILFATVENDIHDIGKNIVIALLESHNYEIIDLGINVNSKKIIKKVLKYKPDVLALSALMTTTAAEMKSIINQLNEKKIKIPILIGGAVITKNYAKNIKGIYGKDALHTIKVINKLIPKKFSLSLELIPSKKLDLKKLNDLKEKIDFITITQGSGGSKIDENFSFIKKLKKNTSIPLMPHIVARDHSKNDIKKELLKLKKIGIKKLLVIHGDCDIHDEFHSDYKYAYELIKDVSNKNFDVFVAGHPEYKLEKSKKFMKEKVNSGAKGIITQIIFDIKDYKKYQTILRENNINIPIIAGIFQLTNKKQFDIIKKLGVKIPKKLEKKLESIDNKSAYEFGIKYTSDLIKKLKKIGVDGIHIFSMNNIQTSKKILEKI